MAILKTIDELVIGDKFLTEDWNGKPTKYTVSGFDSREGVCWVEEHNLDIYMDDFYVVEEAS